MPTGIITLLWCTGTRYCDVTTEKQYCGRPSLDSPGDEDEGPGGAVDIETEWHQRHSGFIHLHAKYGHLVPELVDVCPRWVRV